MTLLDTLGISPTGEGLEVAKGITDFGMMAVTAAFFLVLTGLLWVVLFRWFKNIVDKMVEEHAELLGQLLTEIRQQNALWGDLAEDARQNNLMRTKSLTSALFDLAVERVRHIIDKVRAENHIADREATHAKIRTLLQNLHDDRNTRLDVFSYRGKPLSSYTNPEWVAWVADVVEREIYSDKPNTDRAQTNVTLIYERIRIDFYKRLTNDYI